MCDKLSQTVTYFLLLYSDPTTYDFQYLELNRISWTLSNDAIVHKTKVHEILIIHQPL